LADGGRSHYSHNFFNACREQAEKFDMLVCTAVVAEIEHKILTGFCVLAFTKLPAGLD